jgi:hypothetical protein
VYGHPNARILFGKDASLAEPGDAQQAPRNAEEAPPIAPVLLPGGVKTPGERTTPVAPIPAGERPVSAAAGNLRIKRSFTDRDRDQFVDESFNYITEFFDNSLAELERQNPGIETRLLRIDRGHFSATIYQSGDRMNSCHIWRDYSRLGAIAYSMGDAWSPNSYNESLSVQDDGYSLSFRSFGRPTFNPSDQNRLSKEEAAEHLWQMLISRLR